MQEMNSSGISGTFTATDNADGTTTLVIELRNANDLHPWGIYVLDNCEGGVPPNQDALFFVPDIENGRKEEAVETQAFKSAPGNLVVVVFAGPGRATIVACAELGPPAADAISGGAEATQAAAEECETTAEGVELPPPPGGGRIAFTLEHNNNSDIYVINADGSGLTRLTTHPASDFDPTWSPDGTRIAFRSTRDGNDEIYMMNADGSCQINLTNNPADDWSPAWSPDGAQIAFASVFDGNPYTDIAVINVDGTGLVRLTTAHGEYPVWSPDGARIAFDSLRDGNYEIYVMNADGSGQTNLTNSPAADGGPTWSPDGTRIAFETERDIYPRVPTDLSSEAEIYVMNADGSGAIRLTDHAGEDRFPAWSPDGSRIAFTSDHDPGSGIYLMSTDGSGVTWFSEGTFPAWQP